MGWVEVSICVDAAHHYSNIILDILSVLSLPSSTLCILIVLSFCSIFDCMWCTAARRWLAVVVSWRSSRVVSARDRNESIIYLYTKTNYFFPKSGIPTHHPRSAQPWRKSTLVSRACVKAACYTRGLWHVDIYIKKFIILLIILFLKYISPPPYKRIKFWTTKQQERWDTLVRRRNQRERKSVCCVWRPSLSAVIILLAFFFSFYFPL